MADRPYHEKITATVELNLTDFQAKMKAADASVNAIASEPGVRRKGISFQDAGDALIVAAVKAMEDFTDKVQDDSAYQVPKDTFVLAESWGSSAPYREGNRIKIVMGYGFGEDINPKTKRMADQYALPVHEIYNADHSPPTKSHYLIDPLIDRAKDLQFEMAISMKSTQTYLKSGGGTLQAFVNEGYVEPRSTGFGGGAVIRGGNPRNPGQFTKVMKPR